MNHLRYPQSSQDKVRLTAKRYAVAHLASSSRKSIEVLIVVDSLGNEKCSGKVKEDGDCWYVIYIHECLTEGANCGADLLTHDY